MKNKHKKGLYLGLLRFTNKELLVYSLALVMLGIFLLPKAAYFSSITDENIINKTNEERLDRGLQPLTANQLLAQAAYNKANALFESQTFAHQIGSRTFSSWIKDTGYVYDVVGENLALNFITSEGTVTAWMASPSHKKNILNENFSEIGIAVKEGEFNGERTTVVVQIFGDPRAETASLESSKLTIGENRLWLPLPSESTPESTIVYLNTSSTRSYLAQSDIEGSAIVGKNNNRIFNPSILGTQTKQDNNLTGYFRRLAPFSALLESGEGNQLNSIKKFFQKEFPTNGSLLLGLIISLSLFIMLAFSLIRYYEKILLSIKKIDQKQTG